MKSVPVYEKVNTVSIVAYLKDFIGDNEQWRNAYFQMLSWKNTWELVYQLDIKENRSNGVYVWLILHKPQNADRTISMMNDLGYQNVKTYHVTVGEIELDGDYDYIFEM